MSIDGGGCRGIIPAFWLCEIENKIKRPISHVFNLIAGTSTGALIAAGLSYPLRTELVYETVDGKYEIVD